MHRLAIAAMLLSSLATAAAAQQSGTQNPLPHAWLFGEWTGGLFPPPVTLSSQECQANPTVIFTRDAILRAVPTDVTYSQASVETVRAIPNGVEFRLSVPPQSLPSSSALGLGPAATPQSGGFACNGQGVLRVQRRGEDQITFPSCPEFPYPLARCPTH